METQNKLLNKANEPQLKGEYACIQNRNLHRKKQNLTKPKAQSVLYEPSSGIFIIWFS